MADKDRTDEDDRSLDHEDEQDEETAIIMKAINDFEEDDEEDDGGFDQPPIERQSDLPDVVGQKEGVDLVDKAEQAKERGEVAKSDYDAARRDRQKGRGKDEGADAAADKDAPEGKDADAEGKDGEADRDKPEAAAEEEGKKEEPADLTSADIGDLLDGVSDERKGEITRRLDAADRIMRPFTDRADELKRHGMKPEQAVNRLIELNAFAQESPAEYLAWVARETGQDPSEAMTKAAELLGMKLVKADETAGGDDDDEFADPELKALRAENAELKRKAAGQGTEFGPDTPQRQAARNAMSMLDTVRYERDEGGQLVRPHFKKLEPVIAQMSAQHVQRTGQLMTADDLKAVYDNAVKSLGVGTPAPAPAPAPAPQENPAAQAQEDVQEQIEKKAAAAKRAERASKNVDGSGQGATRRPALSADASIEEIIRHTVAQQSE